MEVKTPTFSEKPLEFLHEWLAVRRKGQDFTDTPMGFICQGKLLTSSHPFFATGTENRDTMVGTETILGLPKEEEEVDAGGAESEEDDGSEEDWGEAPAEANEGTASVTDEQIATEVVGLNIADMDE